MPHRTKRSWKVFWQGVWRGSIWSFYTCKFPGKMTLLLIWEFLCKSYHEIITSCSFCASKNPKSHHPSPLCPRYISFLLFCYCSISLVIFVLQFLNLLNGWFSGCIASTKCKRIPDVGVLEVHAKSRWLFWIIPARTHIAGILWRWCMGWQLRENHWWY